MFDNFMRRLYNSPFSPLVISCLLLWNANEYRGWREWCQVALGICWAQGFWSRAAKRWGHSE